MIIYNKEIATINIPYTASLPPKYTLPPLKSKLPSSSLSSSLTSHAANNLTESNINFLKSLNFQLIKH